jgi:hypothetical protein
LLNIEKASVVYASYGNAKDADVAPMWQL